MTKTVIFAGPSLAGTDARSDHDFDWRQPAACGDILLAARQGASVIGLIDGVFEAGPSVWHKEILMAMDHGIAVYGASSMGALRAAECASFGMIGIGQIYSDYASGVRTADADVAVVHAPADLDYAPLTLALVDGEDVVQRLEGIKQPMRLALLKALRDLHFKDRTWDAVLAAAQISAAQFATIRQLITQSGPGLKTRDALRLLTEINNANPVARAAVLPGTTSFMRDLEDRLAQA